jgi:hypothetical protein
VPSKPVVKPVAAVPSKSEVNPFGGFGLNPAVTTFSGFGPAPITAVPTKSAVKPVADVPSKLVVAPFVFANPTVHHSTDQRTTVIRGSDLFHRVVSTIGPHKQTFTHAKHRYIASRMKNVFHSRREMQVDKHRIKAYLMHSLSPTEKDVLNATSEYRNHHLTSVEQIVFADKSRNIKRRVDRQYNKLMKTMFGSAQSTENDT